MRIFDMRGGGGGLQYQYQGITILTAARSGDYLVVGSLSPKP